MYEVHCRWLSPWRRETGDLETSDGFCVKVKSENPLGVFLPKYHIIQFGDYQIKVGNQRFNLIWRNFCDSEKFVKVTWIGSSSRSFSSFQNGPNLDDITKIPEISILQLFVFLLDLLFSNFIKGVKCNQIIFRTFYVFDEAFCR